VSLRIIPYIADIFKNRQGIASQALAGPVRLRFWDFVAEDAPKSQKLRLPPAPLVSALAIMENIDSANALASGFSIIFKSLTITDVNFIIILIFEKV
jgi:hypothetical protein